MSEKLLNERLKEETRPAHEKLDKLVMSKQPFASVENFGKFVQVQATFMKAVQPFYEDAELNAHLPGFQDNSRLAQVLEDLKQLGLPERTFSTPVPTISKAEGIGWLYCSEGSNLGAAFLWKLANKIGLDDTNGASHLKAHEEGRMRHWRAFVAQLNTLAPTKEAEDQAIEGANQAFIYIKNLVKEAYEGV